MHAGGCCQGSADRWGAERPNRRGVASVKTGSDVLELLCQGVCRGEGVKDTQEARG